MKKKDKKNINEETQEITEQEAAAAAETQEEKVLTPEEQIEKLEGEVAEGKDKLLRLQAEFQNYRKRTFKDIANAKSLGLIDTIQPFLQVFDHFNMAMMAAEKSDNMDAILQGMNMIQNEYMKALDELGVVRFDALGKDFDPALHEAVAHEPSDVIEEGKITKQWSCGYRLGEKLLRPATVVVSSGPEVQDENVENSEITE